MDFRTDEQRAADLNTLRAARKERARRTADSKANSDLIRIVIDHTPDLTFGYIGNYESWGDGRQYYIEHTSGTTLWSCEAKSYNLREASKLSKILKAYRLGAGITEKINLTDAKYMNLK